MKTNDGSLTDAQLRAELARCEFCEEKPCREACPAHCSPADFIMAARMCGPADFRRSGALILSANPLGWVCGVVCPDYFCMKACSRRLFDSPIKIPAVQATVMKKAYAAGLHGFKAAPWNGKTVAVIGAGPAGLGAAAVLAQLGYRVNVFEKQKRLGGMMNLIPASRLAATVTRTDIDFIKGLGAITFKTGKPVTAPAELLDTHAAVIVSVGLNEPLALNVPGEEYTVSWQSYLEGQTRFPLSGKRVAVLGGGAVAVDCATTAKKRGALAVELIYRRRLQDMPLTAYERELLVENGIEISTCCRVVEVVHQRKRIKGLRLVRLELPKGKAPRPANFVANPKEPAVFRQFDVVISAIGSRSRLPLEKQAGVFYAGDMVGGSGTVVEAVASGKNAALEADEYIRRRRSADFQSAVSQISNLPNVRTPPTARTASISQHVKSRITLPGANFLPVPLEAEFFGRKLLSPFLLSAAPHTDGYPQMRAAYERGWSGGVMKTAFDNVPVHIPGEYMTVLGPSTYGNCDNVSGHPLDRVCREVERLVREFPDRLTLASTGGQVTGRDEQDRAVWQSNTKKLESTGAMGVEYSLSCPQGGDGTHGDMVSQNAELTAKIIGWVLEGGAPDIPKLFKLTAAVTAIQPLVKRIHQVFAQFPNHKAGITLANSFPGLDWREGGRRAEVGGQRSEIRSQRSEIRGQKSEVRGQRSEVRGQRSGPGVVIGISGEGVLPITNLTLAKVAGLGVIVSANGGAMNYRAAANFLALGARTVQFCTIVMKYGLGIVDELHSGLSWFLEDSGFKSVRELIGSALPDPIRDFMSLSAAKKLPEVTAELCRHCGNCTRCPYQAVRLDRHGVPRFDAALCVGCSLCAQKCFAGALAMRSRTPAETAALANTEANPL